MQQKWHILGSQKDIPVRVTMTKASSGRGSIAYQNSSSLGNSLQEKKGY